MKAFPSYIYLEMWFALKKLALLPTKIWEIPKDLKISPSRKIHRRESGFHNRRTCVRIKVDVSFIPRSFNLLWIFLLYVNPLNPHSLTDMWLIIRFTRKEHPTFEDTLFLFEHFLFKCNLSSRDKKETQQEASATAYLTDVCEFLFPSSLPI